MRVLVVDDYPDGARVLAKFAEFCGHESRTAESGPQALQIADGWHPDIVLLDIAMPEMDGYEVAKRLRHSGSADAHIYAVSGQTDDPRKRQAAGIERHYRKPVS